MQLVLGGILGAAQLSVLSGLLVDHFNPQFVLVAGWLLLIVPVGALAGVAIVAIALNTAGKSVPRAHLVVSWCLAVFHGFPIAMVAPIFLVGAGPDHQEYRYVACVVQYSILWLALLFFCARSRDKLE
jgi:MFS family permease